MINKLMAITKILARVCTNLSLDSSTQRELTLHMSSSSNMINPPELQPQYLHTSAKLRLAKLTMCMFGLVFIFKKASFLLVFSRTKKTYKKTYKKFFYKIKTLKKLKGFNFFISLFCSI